MRVTTKVWLVTSAVAFLVVLVGTFVSTNRQIDQRIEDTRRFNGEVAYEGIRLFVDEFGAPVVQGTSPLFTVEDLMAFTEVGGVDLVEIYAADGSRLFTTGPPLTAAQADPEAIDHALRGSTASSVWISGSRPDDGYRVQELGLLRILRGGEFADEFWGPLRDRDGETLGVTRALVGMPGLHDDAVAIVLTNALTGSTLVVALGVTLWLTLQVLVRRPLAALTATTRRIRQGQVSMRAPVLGRDELGDLATSFNAMANELERQATTDSITGLLNHRYGRVSLDDAFQRARLDDGALSVLVGDIDGFKLFNDTYGHALGDEVLRLVAGVLRRISDGSGIPSRYGGDEFLIVLPSADSAEAGAFADRLAAAVGETEFQSGDGSRVPISLSLGVASFPEDAQSKDHLLALADAAMYEAKRLGGMGRGAPRVVAVGGSPSESVFGALDGLVRAIQYRDRYTKTHSDMVSEYSAKLALRAGLSEEAVRALRIAGALHDVGKLIVPDDILKKPGPLTLEEYDVIKRHPSVGETLIRETPFFEDVIQAVGCHHESYDGSGYPRGLRGDEIPLLGRVLAVADAYSAMCLDRPYRKALTDDEIVGEFRAGAGTRFDPRLVDIFLEMLQAEEQARAA